MMARVQAAANFPLVTGCSCGLLANHLGFGAAAVGELCAASALLVGASAAAMRCTVGLPAEPDSISSVAATAAEELAAMFCVLLLKDERWRPRAARLRLGQAARSGCYRG